MTSEPAARSASVARLAPRPIREWTDAELAAMRGHLRRAEKYLTRDPAAPPLPGLLGLFGNHPTLTSAFLGFSGQLLDTPAIPARDREVVILRLAYRTRCHYEWAQHVGLGQAEAGLTAEHLEAVVAGAAHPLWSGHDRVLIGATDEMLDTHRIADDTYAALAARYDGRQLMEFLFVVAAYLGLALVLNAVDLPPDGSNPPALPTEVSP